MLTTVYFFQIFVVVVAEHSCIQLPTLFFSSFADFRGYFFRYNIWFPFAFVDPVAAFEDCYKFNLYETLSFMRLKLLYNFLGWPSLWLSDKF